MVVVRAVVIGGGEECTERFVKNINDLDIEIVVIDLKIMKETGGEQSIQGSGFCMENQQTKSHMQDMVRV